jgi:hypothetical protein
MSRNCKWCGRPHATEKAVKKCARRNRRWKVAKAVRRAQVKEFWKGK